MSLIHDLIYFENPTIWDNFGGTSSGYGGLVWQMFIWSVLVGVLVIAWLGYALVFFRHKDGEPEPDDALKVGVFPHERGNIKIELAWTIAPLILVIWLTFLSLAPLNYMWDDPDEADITIDVVATRFSWGFSDYDKPEEFTKCGLDEGMGCIELPANRIIRFNITSTDVLHAFFFPEIGIKQDAVPGLTTIAWLDTSTVEPRDEPYEIYCTEYCGKSHSKMLARVYITEVQNE